jgi:hypothetical protein
MRPGKLIATPFCMVYQYILFKLNFVIYTSGQVHSINEARQAKVINNFVSNCTHIVYLLLMCPYINDTSSNLAETEFDN